jgi:hypothetical protein
VARPRKNPEELCNSSFRVYLDRLTDKNLKAFTGFRGFNSKSNAARYIISLFFKGKKTVNKNNQLSPLQEAEYDFKE